MAQRSTALLKLRAGAHRALRHDAASRSGRAPAHSRDLDDARVVLRRASKLGVDHIDTAHVYNPDAVNHLMRGLAAMTCTKEILPA